MGKGTVQGDNGWRTRLARAVHDDVRSQRAISSSAGLNPGYLNSVFSKGGKSPTVENLLAICEALGVSATWVLYGTEVTPQDEELVSLLSDSPEMRTVVLDLLRTATKRRA